MNNFLNKMKNISNAAWGDVFSALGEQTNADILVADITGTVLQKAGNFAHMLDDANKIKRDFNMKFSTMLEAKLLDDETFIQPIQLPAGPMGVMVLRKTTAEFSEEDYALAIFAATVFALKISTLNESESADKIRKTDAVKAALGVLSYSELESIMCMCKQLNGTEGIVVTSKIADSIGITRSVIVNALRKLESANVIESRSLGMKGTHVKIVNEFLSAELDKL